MSDRPFLPYGRQWLDEDDVQAVACVLRGDWLTTGPLVEEFERAVARRAGARHATAVSSGTAALHTAYFSAGLGRGDGILTSPLTFAATASVALQLGAEVRFADVDPSTGNLDPEAAEEAIGPSTRLLVPVDYAGHPADYDRLVPLARKHDLGVVADAAHSFGAAHRGRPVGCLADATAVSFHPVKLITTGEGGVVLTDRDEWRTRASLFRNHGMVRDTGKDPQAVGAWYYEIRTPGLNYRLPDVLCALGLSQLRKLDRFIARRRAIAARYSEALAGIPGLELPTARAEVEPAWHLYVIRVSNPSRRKPLFDLLRRQGLGVQLHYIPVHLHPLYEGLGHRPGAFPHAESFAARAISIPIFPRMTDADVERVIETVAGGAAASL